MKTYIWRTEYEVFVINKESIEEAREELKFMLIQRQISTNRDSYFTTQPLYILEYGESLCFDHSNE